MSRSRGEADSSVAGNRLAVDRVGDQQIGGLGEPVSGSGRGGEEDSGDRPAFGRGLAADRLVEAVRGGLQPDIARNGGERGGEVDTSSSSPNLLQEAYKRSRGDGGFRAAAAALNPPSPP
jgi:hypothetical protein